VDLDMHREPAPIRSSAPTEPKVVSADLSEDGDEDTLSYFAKLAAED